MAVKQKMDAAVRQAYTAPYNSWSNRIATLRFVQDIPLGPEDDAYATVLETETGLEKFVETPMLICWGEQDFVFDESFLIEWQRRFPKAIVHRFPNAGHYVLEDEGDAILGHVNRFLGNDPTESS